ncbi:MAG: MFS transporter [Fluviicoccus sp.]|uniref:MFS transporter n=1 Tax=Fluviicoccus sp. TaxID=2003552 RepID=UPI002716A068|nr:MFS transporter [Fluviicoccus sp.]MDO8328850.1 MFS transporter [Fluviicoccus sp.]
MRINLPAVASTGRPTGSAANRPLASLSLIVLLSSLASSIANVGLPALAQVFNASFANVQWVVIAYLLSVTALVVSAGRLGDQMGRRRLLLAGIWLFTAASVLCGLAPSLGWLIAARAVQGIGAAVMMALTLALAGETAPKAKTGSAMGFLGTMSAVGTAMGPVLGGLLIAGFGWRFMFVINLPLGLLAVWLASRYLPQDATLPKTRRIRFDVPGAVLLAVTLVAYALAMTTVRDESVLLLLLTATAVGLGLFLWVESRTVAPLIRLSLFRQAVFSRGFAMSALVTTVMMSTLVVGPFYLDGALGLSPVLTGLVMSAGPAAAALAGVPSGLMVDRFGATPMTVCGLAAMLAGAMLLSILSGTWGIPGYVAPLMCLTAGFALFQAANNTAVLANTGPQQRGVISGLLNLSRNLGFITGATVMGAVFAWTMVNAQVTAPEAVAAGMRMTFAVASALILAAIFIASLKRDSSTD